MATRSQTRIAEALADPNVKTITQAAEIAGISRTHAHRALQNATVMSKVMEIKQERAASLSGIRKKTIGELAKRINADATDGTVLGALKVTTDALATLPEPEIDPEIDYPHLADRSWIKRHRRRALLRAYRLGAQSMGLEPTDPPETGSTPQDDAIDVEPIGPVRSGPPLNPEPIPQTEETDEARAEMLRQQAAMLLSDETQQP